MLEHLSVLVVGGDASVRIALNDALGEGGSAMFLAGDVGPAELLASSAYADLIVAVISDHPDPPALLGACRDLGLQRRTLAIGDALDRSAAQEAVALGVAGYITAGSDASHLVKAISHVVDNGVILDPQAADAYSGQISLDFGSGLKLSAARAFASALELKDTYTGGHAERVT
ncbi:MAG TPA: hypothetical protein VNP73_07380, partial [Actinomycetota bacterium]|nr:hypothetical protein [Actinomycetota bacterium]